MPRHENVVKNGAHEYSRTSKKSPLFAGGQPHHMKYKIAKIAAVLVLFGVLTVSVAETILPEPDEATYGNPGYNLIYNGHSGTTLMELRGHMPLSLARRTYWQFPLYFFLTAAWYKIFGFGLLQVRLLSAAFGLVALLSWYVIVKQLCRSEIAGLLAMTLISVDYYFVLGASQGRMELVCAGFGAAALAAYLGLRERSLVAAFFWSHVFATLSIVTHAVGLGYWLGVVLLILSLDRHSLSWKILLAGVAPCVIGAAIWGTFILRDPGEFIAQMNAQLALVKAVFNEPGLSRVGMIRSAQLELRHRYIEPFGLGSRVGLAQRVKSIVLAEYIASLAGILLIGRARRQMGLLLMGCITLVSMLFLMFGSPSKFAYYLPHITPFLAACLAVFAFSISSGRVSRWIVTAVVLLASGIQLAGLLYRIHDNPMARSYLPAIAAIKSNSTPHSIIMGDGELWFGLEHDRYLINDWNFGGISGVVPNLIVMDPTYFSLLEKRKGSALYEPGEKLLKSSRLVYQGDFYQVYVH